MDFFKDEKTASRGEEPRNSLSVSSIVEAQRATEKKQTFDLLCPGVSHRLQASSEAEADEWVTVVKELIVYRKDDQRSSTSSLTIPELNAHPHPNLPTPPEQVFSNPIPVTPGRRPVLKTFSSSPMEATPQHPFPSPNSSSDSSSQHSTSTCSAEGQNRSVLAAEATPEQRLANGRYRVCIKDCEQLLSGEYELAVEDDSLKLYQPGQNVLITSWHIGTLRRYGVNKICFTIDVGRHGPMGEGKFFFYTGLSSLLYSEVHRIAQRIDALPKGAMLSQWCTSPTKKDSDSASTITSVSACTPSAGYSRLNHRSASAFLAPGSGGHIYGTLCHDGNVSGSSAYDDTTVMPTRQNQSRGGSQPTYSTCYPQQMMPAASHTLPCVRSTSTPGDYYLTHSHSSSSDSSENTQASQLLQRGDTNTTLVEEEVPPPLPPKPQRSISVDNNGASYMNCRALPVPPRTRTSQETNTML